MNKGLKIAAISLSVVAVIVAGLVIWQYYRNRAKKQLALSDVTPVVTPTTIIAPARKPFSPRDLGPGQLQPTGNPFHNAVPNIYSVNNPDLVEGCKILIDSLPNTNVDKSTLKTMQYTEQTYKYLVNIWLDILKARLDQLTSAINSDNLVAASNELYRKLITVFGSNPTISYRDAADGLVWMDKIVRQTLLIERYNFLRDIIANQGQLAPDGRYITKFSFPWNENSMPTDAAKQVFRSGKMDERTMIISMKSGDYIGYDGSSGGVKTNDRFMHRTIELITEMGNAQTPADINRYEQLIDKHLNDVRMQIAPTAKEMQERTAKQQKELQTVITIIKMII